MSYKGSEALCEVVFDIGSNLSVYLNAMDEDERDAFMEEIDGSRGLFWQHALQWAREFQTKWVNDAQPGVERDYLIHIDEFTKKKFDELRASALPDVVSIQVVPVIHHPRTDAQNEHAEPQFGGPDEHTTCWAVYERGRKGLARWVADFGKEGDAQRFGAMLSHQYGVSIEAQPWKVKQAQIITQDLPDQRFRVMWQIDIDAPTAHDAAVKALRIQRDIHSHATVFEVLDDHGGLVERIDLSQELV